MKTSLVIVTPLLMLATLACRGPDGPDLGLEVHRLGSFTPTRVEIAADRQGNSRLTVAVQGEVPNDITNRLRQQGFRRSAATGHWQKRGMSVAVTDRGFEAAVGRGELPEDAPRLDLTSIFTGSRLDVITDPYVYEGTAVDEHTIGTAFFEFPTAQEGMNALSRSDGMGFRQHRPSFPIRVTEHLDHVVIMNRLGGEQGQTISLSLNRKHPSHTEGRSSRIEQVRRSVYASHSAGGTGTRVGSLVARGSL